MVFKFFGNFRRRFFKQIWWRWNLIFLTKARNIPHDCLKKNNSCFEVNAFIEILNCRIYTTPQKKKKKKKKPKKKKKKKKKSHNKMFLHRGCFEQSSLTALALLPLSKNAHMIYKTNLYLTSKCMSYQ